MRFASLINGCTCDPGCYPEGKKEFCPVHGKGDTTVGTKIPYGEPGWDEQYLYDSYDMLYKQHMRLKDQVKEAISILNIGTDCEDDADSYWLHKVRVIAILQDGLRNQGE